MPRGNQDSLAALAAAALANDPELQRDVRSMVRRIIKNTELTLTFGTPQDKIALNRAIMPNLMRQLAVVDDDNAAKSEADAYARMRADMGGDD